LKGRTLSTALKKKAREIWGQATEEQKQLYAEEENAVAGLAHDAVDAQGVQEDDDDLVRDPDFVSRSGVFYIQLADENRITLIVDSFHFSLL
jgi:hypothetical protein